MSNEKDEGFSSPPASPAQSPPSAQLPVHPPASAPVSMASLASLARAGLAQAPGSYPHAASGPGQPQTNGGSDRPLQLEHRQPPQVKIIL